MKDSEYNYRLNEIAKVIGYNIAKSRGGISKIALSQKAGISRMTLKEIEEGKRKPNLKTLFKIADALGLEIYELFKPIETVQKGEEKLKNLLDKIEDENVLIIQLLDRLIERRLKKSK